MALQFTAVTAVSSEISSLSLWKIALKISAFSYGFCGVMGLLRPSYHSVYKDFGYKVEDNPSVLTEPHLREMELREDGKDYYTTEELENESEGTDIPFSRKKTCRIMNRNLGESNLTENRSKSKYHEHVSARNEKVRLRLSKEGPLKEDAFWKRASRKKCNSHVR